MTARRLKAAAVVGWALAALAPPALAQAPAGPAATFEARCKSCHEPALERAPSRAELARRNPAVVVEALTTGVMAPMARGLSGEQIADLASYLTGARARGPAPAAQPADVACAKHPPVQAGLSDWVGFGADAAATRFQPRPGLTAADVPALKVKWAFALSGGRYGQPTVIGDRVFVATASGHAFALDAASGCVHWRADLGAGSRTSPMVVRLKRGWVAVVGDVARDIHALDAQTGRELWKVSVDDHPRGRITGSIAYHDGVLYVPVSSAEETIATVPDYPCCTFAGSVVALDAATGQRLWKTPLVEAAKPTRKNSAGTQMFGPAGAAIWSQPSLDVKRGRLYVATGDSYTEVEAPRSDAVVALALKDGKVLWENQVTPNDNFLTACGAQRRGLNCPLGEIGPDYDFGASPILATAPGGRQVVLSGQKSGVAYGMDPATGKRLWATKIGAGSAIGGIEWGMAYDGRALFASVSDAGARQDPKPGVYALDPLTGRLLWSAAAPKVPCSFKAPRCSNAYAAPPTAIPGVVFTGSHDGWLRAYDSSSGKLVFGFDTAGQTYATTNGVRDQPGGSIDATGPVVAGGRLFVISGYSGASGGFGNPLNVLLAFEPAR